MLNTDFCDVNIAPSIRAPHVVVSAEVNAQPSLSDSFDAHSDYAVTNSTIIQQQLKPRIDWTLVREFGNRPLARPHMLYSAQDRP